MVVCWPHFDALANEHRDDPVFDQQTLLASTRSRFTSDLNHVIHVSFRLATVTDVRVEIDGTLHAWEQGTIFLVDIPYMLTVLIPDTNILIAPSKGIMASSKTLTAVC